MLPVVPDTVDGGQPADEREKHELEMAREHVPDHQAVEDGKDQGDGVVGQEGENDDAELVGNGEPVNPDIGQDRQPGELAE